MEEHRKWFKGDTHLHTTNSDGKMTRDELVKECIARGLDWAIITDHNFSTVEVPYRVGGFQVMQGEEVTAKPGHLNLWGANLPFKAPYVLDTPEDYKAIIARAREAGALVSVNHPFCKKCGWHMTLDDFDFDCVEVWNAPMHIDDMVNLRWWHNELLRGRRLTAVGGSDYHRDHYHVTRLVGNPTTVCLAASNSQEDIMRALKNGNCFVTQGPSRTMLYLSSNGAYAGETTPWEPGIRAQLKIEKLKAGHRVEVYCNDTVIYRWQAKKSGTHEASFEVPEIGFVRAEVLYEYKGIAKLIYKKIIAKLMPLDKDIPVPAFAYCFTNPVFFE